MKLSQTFLYGLTGIILLLLGFISTGTIDIVQHDTYYVIANSHVYFVLALLFWIFAVVAFLLIKGKRKFNNTLFYIHYLLSVVGIITLIILLNFPVVESMNHDYSVYGEFETTTWSEQKNSWISLIIVIVLFAQLLFVFNLFRSLVRKKRIDWIIQFLREIRF